MLGSLTQFCLIHNRVHAAELYLDAVKIPSLRTSRSTLETNPRTLLNVITNPVRHSLGTVGTLHTGVLSDHWGPLGSISCWVWFR